MPGENVIVVTFTENKSAYEAFTNLKELGDQGQVKIEGAAIAERNQDGSIATKDAVGNASYTGTTTGGLIGLLVGILGGPFGVLIGGATGLLIGSLYDVDDAEDTQSVLAQMSKAIKPGQTVVLADLDEQSDDVVDEAMKRLGGTVLRRSVDDVEAEVAAAADAERAAKREARKQLMETRRSRARDEIRRIVDELKARAHALREKLHAATHRE